MNYKLTVVPLALSAVLYLNGCGGQSNYTPEKMIEKPKMKYKLNVSTMEGATIKVGDAQYTPNMELLEGTHTVVISKDGYENENISFNLNSDSNITAKLKKPMKFEGTVNWTVGDDFAGGYFDVFYENGLFYALPSIYANNFEDIMINNYQDPRNCNRKEPKELSGFISVSDYDVAYKNRFKVELSQNSRSIGKFLVILL